MAKTSKPLSTVTWNSEQFLVNRLNDLMKNGVISYWCYVLHKAEKSEGKDHIHLYFEPRKMVDPVDFRSYLCEVDIANPSKPIMPSRIQPSKGNHWVAYCRHDPVYIKKYTKEGIKEYEYSKDAFKSSDDILFEQQWEEGSALCYDENAELVKTIVEDGAISALQNGLIGLRDFACADRLEDKAKRQRRQTTVDADVLEDIKDKASAYDSIRLSLERSLKRQQDLEKQVQELKGIIARWNMDSDVYKGFERIHMNIEMED